MTKTENFDQVHIAAPEQLWDWLSLNHAQEQSVWLVTWKKETPEKYVSREQVLDALIAYGWIDGIRRKRDDGKTMQLIGPRQQKVWAKTYKDRAERLDQEGRMQPAGRRAIEQAKATGLWGAMEDVDALVVPDDLTTALKAQPPANAYFEGAAPSYRRNILRWIGSAKTEPTRAKRIGIVVEHSAERRKVPNY
jgi:uncharacterized protein YdeI (YjbR/CyaY-like superfamily)